MIGGSRPGAPRIVTKRRLGAFLSLAGTDTADAGRRPHFQTRGRSSFPGARRRSRAALVVVAAILLVSIMEGITEIIGTLLHFGMLALELRRPNGNAGASLNTTNLPVGTAEAAHQETPRHAS